MSQVVPSFPQNPFIYLDFEIYSVLRVSVESAFVTGTRVNIGINRLPHPVYWKGSNTMITTACIFTKLINMEKAWFSLENHKICVETFKKQRFNIH